MINNTKLDDEDYNYLMDVFKTIFDNRNNSIKDLFNELEYYGINGIYDIIKCFESYRNYNLNLIGNLNIILIHMSNSYRNIKDEVNEIYFEYLDTVNFDRLFSLNFDEMTKINFSSKMEELDKSIKISRAIEYANDIIDNEINMKEYAKLINTSPTMVRKTIDRYLAYDLETYIKFIIYFNKLKPISNEKRINALEEIKKEFESVKSEILLEKDKLSNRDYDNEGNIVYHIRTLEIKKEKLEKYINILSLEKYYSLKTVLLSSHCREYIELIFQLNNIMRARNNLVKTSKNNLELVYKLFDEKVFIQ